MWPNGSCGVTHNTFDSSFRRLSSVHRLAGKHLFHLFTFLRDYSDLVHARQRRANLKTPTVIVIVPTLPSPSWPSP